MQHSSKHVMKTYINHQDQFLMVLKLADSLQAPEALQLACMSLHNSKLQGEMASSHYGTQPLAPGNAPVIGINVDLAMFTW